MTYVFGVKKEIPVNSSIGGVFCLVAQAGDTVVGAASPMTG